MQTDADRALLPYLWALSFVGLYLLLRSPFIGVYLGAYDLRIRSWFVTQTTPVESIRSCEVVAYSGLLTKWSDSARLGVLRLHWVDGNGFLRARASFGGRFNSVGRSTRRRLRSRSSLAPQWLADHCDD